MAPLVLFLRIFSSIGYICAATAFLLGAYILSKNMRNVVNQTAFLLTTSTSVWSFGLASEVISLSMDSGLFWSRFLHSGVIFIPVTYFHFIAALLGIDKPKKRIIQAAYCAATLLFILNIKGFVVPSVSPKGFFNYYTNPGPLYPVLLAGFFLYASLAIIFLLKRYGQCAGAKRMQ